MNKFEKKIASQKPEDVRAKKQIIKKIKQLRKILDSDSNEVFLDSLKDKYEQMSAEDRLRALFKK